MTQQNSGFIDRLKRLVAGQPICDLIPGGSYKIVDSKYWRAWCARCGEPIRVPWIDTQKPCLCQDCDPMIDRLSNRVHQPTKGELMVPWQLEKYGEMLGGG